MERLGHLITNLVQSGQWKPIKLSRHGAPLSHLFFVDDLILFAEASTSQMDVIKQCLDLFCAMSGQKVSLQKSNIHFSNGITLEEAKIISNMVGIPSSLNLGKNLGTPSIHDHVTKVLYQPLIDRIAIRLSGWKTGFLSFAGRVTLAKSVLTSIPIYVMQYALLPVGVCNNIDKLVQNFI